MAIKDSTIERVRRVPLTDILEAEQIPYKRIGREAVTHCPWHNDSNPSLTINDDKGMCFCFACGGGSDGISYVQQKFGLGFADAVLRIAGCHEIVVEYDNLDPEEALRIAEERKRTIDALLAQHQRFRDCIRTSRGKSAREWLMGRQITPEASRHFELGWGDLDRQFGARVTVPIHDHRGTLVGFTGRQIDDAHSGQKYRNSKDGPLFSKGALVFNEHRAAQAARAAGYMVFVEGHFDVISMWQYGMQNVVATQGTAGPMIESIKRLMRHCRRFVLAYDGDQGGQKAIEHFVAVAGPLACKGELTLTVAQLPQGLDPDECIRSGIDLHAIIEGAPQWLDWQIDCWLAGLDRSDTHRFSQAEAAIREFVESIKSPALRQHYIDKTSKVLASDAKSASKLAQTWSRSLPKLGHSGTWSKPDPSWIRNQVERRALRSFIHLPDTRNQLRPILSNLQGPSHIWLWTRLQEIEAYCGEVTPSIVKAILAVCEPQYVRVLRPLVMPTIKVENQSGILDHVEHVLTQNVEVDL